MAVNETKLEKKPLLYIVSGLIPLITVMALYILDGKNDEIEKGDIALKECQDGKEEVTEEYMDLFKECND